MKATGAPLRRPKLFRSLVPLVLVLPLFSPLGAAAKDAAKPRVIVIDPSSSPSTEPTDDATGKAPVAASEEEQRAQDNALLAGAVELEPTMRMGDEARRVEREIVVHGGRCYSISVAWKATYRATITYSFGRASDGRAINDFSNGDSGLTYPREGVIQFCADRTGPVKVGIVAEDAGSGGDLDHEYVVVVGSRQETAAQRDARHRRASGVKNAVAPEQPKRAPSRKVR